nr:hypothetical protein [Tanacetum cinerariifolium]
IIPGPAGILQLAQLRKTAEIKEGGHKCEMLTQEVKVFHKDASTVNSGSGASTSKESYWVEEI